MRPSLPLCHLHVSCSCRADLTSPLAALAEAEVDRRIQRDDEFSDSEDEGEGNRRDRQSHRGGSASRKAASATARSKSPAPAATTAAPAPTSIPSEESSASAAAPVDAPVATAVAPLPANVTCGTEDLLPPLKAASATNGGASGSAAADAEAAAAQEGDADMREACEMPVQGTSAARLTTEARPGEDDARGPPAAVAAEGAADVEMKE